MIDRLYELHRRRGQPLPPYQRYAARTDVYLGSSNRYLSFVFDERQYGISKEFFERVKRAKAIIGLIQENSQKTKELRMQYAKATRSAHYKEISMALERIIAANRDHHENLKGLLTEMKEQVEADESNEETKDEPETRMKRNFYTSLTNNMAKVLEEERIAYDAFKKLVKDKVGRQVQLVDRNLTPNEVDHYVNNPEEANQMLQRRVMGFASAELTNAVADIQDKLRDVQRLERSVAECVQLFKELAQLVQYQGALIDNIEVNVNQTKNYVYKAEKNLVKAKEHHKCTKKCMCWLLIAGIIILVIVVVLIIVFIKR